MRSTREQKSRHGRFFESQGSESSELWRSDSYELESVISDVACLSGGSELKATPPSGDLITQYSTNQEESLCPDLAFASAPKQPGLNNDDFVEPASELAFLGAAAQTASHLLEQLRHPGTGLFTQFAFMHFLEHELGRFHSFQTPCSLVIFSIATPQHETIPIHAAAVAAARLTLAVDRLNVVGHFDRKRYALLLPNVVRQQAALVTINAFELLTASPLADGINKSNLKLSSGIASVPEDACDLRL